jgi:hypothetical protein
MKRRERDGEGGKGGLGTIYALQRYTSSDLIPPTVPHQLIALSTVNS